MHEVAHVLTDEGPGLIPALDPSAPYTSRLSARSALYTDLHVLLDARETPLSSSFRSLVIDENRLVRKSIAARQKTWQELKSRYILDIEHPLFAAFLKEWRRSRSEAERGLTTYILLSLNDRLVADLGIHWLFPLLRRAPAELRIADIRGFIDGAAKKHTEVRSWSDQTRTAVAQKYAASIRDFGLTKGTVNKVTIRPALYGAPVRLLVRILRLVGVRPLDLIRAPIFRLLALNEEVDGAKSYYGYKERCIYCDIIRQERDSGIRVIAENKDFLTVAPYAPRFPFETWILPKEHESAFEDSQRHFYENLARALKNLLLRVDRVLEMPSYNLVLHTSPVREAANDYYHWHLEMMPKLTRVAGFEWGTGFYINPTPPEEAAKFLREASPEPAG